MYKKILLSILVLCMGKNLIAQNREDVWIWPDDYATDELALHLDTGPMIGGGLATVSNASDFDLSSRIGFAYQFGLSVNARFAHRMNSFPHGLSRLGMGLEVMMGGGTVGMENTSVNAFCFEIPALLNFYLNSELLLEAGPTFVKYFKVNPVLLQAQNVVFHIGDSKPMDVKLTLGVSYKMPTGLAFGIRGNFGTSPMAENINVRANSYMISIKYLFPIMK